MRVFLVVDGAQCEFTPTHGRLDQVLVLTQGLFIPYMILLSVILLTEVEIHQSLNLAQIKTHGRSSLSLSHADGLQYICPVQ